VSSSILLKRENEKVRLYTLAELRSGLRSGDIWVVGSRQFRDFEDYLLSDSAWQQIRTSKTIPVAVDVDFDCYNELTRQAKRDSKPKLTEADLPQLWILTPTLSAEKLIDSKR
jgi:hypothetical protein